MRLSVMLILILLTPVLAVADECTDACDGELADQLTSCKVDYDNRFNECESRSFSETDLCQSELDNCLAGCAGDPSCEADCYSTFDQCNAFAASDYDNCVDDANLDRESCVDFANEDHESCLAACEAVPAGKRSLSILKHRYE